MSDNYKDIMYMRYKKSKNRPHMSVYDRAAQFAPFAALTGHDLAVQETARLTGEKVILDNEVKKELSMKLNFLNENTKNDTEIYVEYFLPDNLKNGGMYITAIGKLKKIDDNEHQLILQNGTKIPIDDILSIESELFSFLE